MHDGSCLSTSTSALQGSLSAAAAVAVVIRCLVEAAAPQLNQWVNLINAGTEHLDGRNAAATAAGMVKSSQYCGVTLFRPTGKWRAQVRHLPCWMLSSILIITYILWGYPTASMFAGCITFLLQPQVCCRLQILCSSRLACCLLRCPTVPIGTRFTPWPSHTQISANGRTTSLGDYDTQEMAAAAFDRAALNKDGADAKTNFSASDYADEMALIQGTSSIRTRHFTAVAVDAVN